MSSAQTASVQDLGFIWERFDPYNSPALARLMRTKATDVMFGGGRGGGKSAGVLGDFVNRSLYWIQELGVDPSTIIGLGVRQTADGYRELTSLFQRHFGHLGVVVGESELRFNVEPLKGVRFFLRSCEAEKDASKFQGHSYNYVFLDEGGQYRTPSVADILKATLRSTVDGLEPKFVMSANPGGPGHGWIKKRYVLPAQPNQVFVGQDEEGLITGKRQYIPARLDDNKAFKGKAKEAYKLNIIGATAGKPELRKAWLDNDWDILMQDVRFQNFDRRIHMVKGHQIPEGWPIYRSMDWGKSSPSAIGWFAIADGNTFLDKGERLFYPKDTRIQVGELFLGIEDGMYDKGLRLTDQEIVARIKGKERSNELCSRADRGVSDTQLHQPYSDGYETPSQRWYEPEDIFFDEVRGKDRIGGWEDMDNRCYETKQKPFEKAGLLFFEECTASIWQMENAQRDENCLDDIQEPDHIADMIRYACSYTPSLGVSVGKMTW